MPKKFSQILLIPTLGLLPLTQAIAEHTPLHHSRETPLAHAPAERPLLGQMLNAKAIQLQMGQQEVLKKYPSDKIHIITLMTTEGKQRFVLLTQARSELVAALAKAHGSIEEFKFYRVLDEEGNDMHLFASKRTVTAPANQLTLLFPTQEDKNSFLKENQNKIPNENIFMLADSSAERAANTQLETTQQMVNAQQGMNSKEDQVYSQEINAINNTISIKAQDHSKSSIIEPKHIFPMLAVAAAATH